MSSLLFWMVVFARTVVPFNFGNVLRLSHNLPPNIPQLVVYAKKKTKLLSEDFLATLDVDEIPAKSADLNIEEVSDAKKAKKNKNKNKLVSEDFLATIDASEDSEEIVDANIHTGSESKKKDKKKDKKSGNILEEAEAASEEAEASALIEIDRETESVSDVAAIAFSLAGEADEEDVPAAVPAAGEETIEQRMRKERPPARVRFAESSQPDFVMMSLDKVSLVYGNKVVLKDASFSVTTGERVGLVGPNGGGKTTQLRILSGEIEPTTGEVVKSSRNLRVAFLRQEFVDGLVPEQTLREELMTSFVEEKQLLDAIAACEAEVERSVDNADKMSEVLDKLQSLQDKAISKGVYSLDAKVDKIMDMVGFSTADATAKVKSFSGGWKMRIGLAKILLQDPNVLLLDEPTNHLDLDSVFWLEDFLQKQNIPMVIVSHDREFLDRVCNKIVDVEEGVTVSYTGNYSRFLDAKKARLTIWREQYEKQTRYIKEEEKWIKKSKTIPSMAQQVTAKEMALEKFLKSEELIQPPPRDKKFRFRFPPAPRCGQNVLETSKLGHGYGTGHDSMLFDDVEIQVDRGERVGFVGPNGAGKSTLMRVISGGEMPKKGFSEFGSSSVEPNYFEQSQADTLNLEQTVFEAVQDGAPSEYSYTDIRTLLGQFMFKGDDADKKLKYLSGGEKARVALCKMMLKPANLLLLDEPTNHLDITSKEVLEEALQNFDGSVLVISHDRYFMSKVANRIFAFENGSVVRYDCDYHDYMCQKGQTSDLKEKIESRYVAGDSYRIFNAPEVIIEETNKSSRSKNFGGSQVTSGNLYKGIKNAKRFANNL